MSEWSWVLAGYAIAYGSIGGYFVVLHRERTRVRRETEGAA